ncbi:MAG: phenylalanine--tRNA ligase subunit beta [bacterium]
MKLSIAWIFDHIDANWQDIDINTIATKFNKITAEIENVHHVSVNLDNFYLAQRTTQTSTTVHVPELKQDVTISQRTDPTEQVLAKTKSSVYLVKKTGETFTWASLADFGLDKAGLIPALDADAQDLTGVWRTKFEKKDIIIEVDNKSITHRPDMWGHRGFAREIAAFLDLPLLPEKKFLAKLTSKQFNTSSQTTETTPFIIENNAQKQCKIFNGLYIPSIKNKPSDIFIMSRLLKVDARPINSLVDLTNYVMLDWSQPVHAYDAEKIAEKKIIIRMAKQDEKLILLDSNELTLTPQDLVIADEKKAIGLAGIMGGLHDSINAQTTSLFFESANFDPGTVRKTALKHKTRSDASSRFEKSLDPNQAIQAIMRFVNLAKQYKLKIKTAHEIVSVGTPAPQETIEIDHIFLENRSGIKLTPGEIKKLLSPLEFGVTIKSKKPLIYTITVPTFRSSKDVKIKEDILEEVVRTYGSEKIALELPRRINVPSDLSPVMRMRKIKQLLAYGSHMIEQQNYSLCDEQNLTELGIQIEAPIHIVNPVSEIFYRLTPSLIPGLLKNIKENSANHESINFFESGRIWPVQKNSTNPDCALEQKSIAGIFFEKRKPVDFYVAKQEISQLFGALGFDKHDINWKKITTTDPIWYMPFQSAHLTLNGKTIGSAGKINPALLAKMGMLPESDAFIFELNGDFLLQEPVETKNFKPFSRFQETYFDISALVPLTLTTKTLEQNMRATSNLINNVQLIDFFEKEEWPDSRSLTFRLGVSHPEKTLERYEIEEIRTAVISAIEKIGAQLRS